MYYFIGYRSAIDKYFSKKRDQKCYYVWPKLTRSYTVQTKQADV